MRTYTRLRIPGAKYFFTVNLAERHDSHLLLTHIGDLRDAFRRTLRDHPFTVEAMVVLPEHLHCIWQLPDGDDNYPLRWRLIKARFSQAVTSPKLSLRPNQFLQVV